MFGWLLYRLVDRKQDRENAKLVTQADYDRARREDWPIYALGESALIVLFFLLLIVAVRLLLDALGIMPL